MSRLIRILLAVLVFVNPGLTQNTIQADCTSCNSGSYKQTCAAPSAGGNISNSACCSPNAPGCGACCVCSWTVTTNGVGQRFNSYSCCTSGNCSCASQSCGGTGPSQSPTALAKGNEPGAPEAAAAETTESPADESLERSLIIGEVVRGLSIQRAELWRAENGKRSYRLRIRNDSSSDILALAIEFKMAGLLCSQGLRIVSFVGGPAIQSRGVTDYSLASSFIPTGTSPGDFPPMTVSVRYVHRADGSSESMDPDAGKVLRLGAKKAMAIARTLIPILASSETDPVTFSRIERLRLQADAEDSETLRLFLELFRKGGRAASLRAAERLAAVPIRD